MTDFERWYAPLKKLRDELNNCQYGQVLSESEMQDLAEDGITIFYGQSDDLLEAEGAFFEEFGAWNGTTIYFTNGYVKAEWTEGEPNWVISTNVPHVTFDMIDEGMIYCRGIIVHQEDLGKFIGDKNDDA